MKRGVIYFVLFLAFAVSVNAGISEQCSVSHSAGGNPLIALNELTNSHAQNANYNGVCSSVDPSECTSFNECELVNSICKLKASYNYYNNVIKCPGSVSFSLIDASSNCPGSKILGLSADTNAHAEVLNNYNKKICASEQVSCSLKSECGLTDSNERCLLKLSSDTNAHVADCSDTVAGYNKLCCVSGISCPEGTHYDNSEKNCVCDDDVNFYFEGGICKPLGFTACYEKHQDEESPRDFSCMKGISLPYPSSNVNNPESYWYDVYNTVKEDCLLQTSLSEPRIQSCCQQPPVTGVVYGTYQNVKILDKQGTCLNC